MRLPHDVTFPVATPSCSSQRCRIWVLVKKEYCVKVKKCISPRHCFQKSHQTKNVLIFPGLLCLCVIVLSVAKSSSVNNGDAFWAEKEEKNADVLFFGFISKDQAVW